MKKKVFDRVNRVEVFEQLFVGFFVGHTVNKLCYIVCACFLSQH